MSRARSGITTEGWTYQDILKSGPRFYGIKRVKATDTKENIERAIREYEDDGKPIIIEGWQEHPVWSEDTFSLDSFKKLSARETIAVRNIHTLQDSEISLEGFIQHCREIPPYATETETARMYGKDAECPDQWRDRLKGLMPPSLQFNGPNDYFRYRPKDTLVETLMCYLGVGDTFTAAHKDLCASSGHNLMCYTENDGASYWFMTEGSDAPDVEAYFKKLGHELDHETHAITLEELARAPFNVYVGKQVLGDLVLVPPRSAHQVVNFGGITLKASWSRMSLKGLSTAFYHELAIYQRVCRFETYRVKSTIFYSLQRRTAELNDLFERMSSDGADGQALEKEAGKATLDLLQLHRLFNDILREEYCPNWKMIDRLDINDDGPIGLLDEKSCDFCGADIFQGFMECSNASCAPQDGATFSICPRCYVEGRSCKDRCAMKPKQVRNFFKLMGLLDNAAKVLEGRGHTLKAFSVPGGDHVSLFAAAYRLYEQIKEKKMILTCVICKAKGPSLSCRACHNSKCFKDLLGSYKFHASDALIAHAYSDKDHAKFHRKHQEARTQYLDRLAEVKECQRSGAAPGEELAPLLRSYIALKHPTCRPIVCSMSTPGCYDKDIQDCDPVSEDSDENDSMDVASDTNASAVEEAEIGPQTIPKSPSPSSATSTSSRNRPAATAASVQSDAPTKYTVSTSRRSVGEAPAKRARMIMDCVAIPSLRKRSVPPSRTESEVPSASTEAPSGTNSDEYTPQRTSSKQKGKQKEIVRIGPPTCAVKKRKPKDSDFNEQLAKAMNEATRKNYDANESQAEDSSPRTRGAKKRKVERSCTSRIDENGVSKKQRELMMDLDRDGDSHCAPEMPPPLPKRGRPAKSQPSRDAGKRQAPPQLSTGQARNGSITRSATSRSSNAQASTSKVSTSAAIAVPTSSRDTAGPLTALAKTKKDRSRPPSPSEAAESSSESNIVEVSSASPPARPRLSIPQRRSSPPSRHPRNQVMVPINTSPSASTTKPALARKSSKQRAGPGTAGSSARPGLVNGRRRSSDAPTPIASSSKAGTGSSRGSILRSAVPTPTQTRRRYSFLHASKETSPTYTTHPPAATVPTPPSPIKPVPPGLRFNKRSVARLSPEV